ncbi:hypothetical protein QYE76_070620 [Lolium multiflorum]|uniref:Reverse transcriptase Ty1/copia-type domain-containing protein n=1 Tax=Lolium multiflorum TaxID=4521 RepID=A0AAD8SKX4_LOLMU|nr:hypothetical protein QYE76_070620 [Lolium multiflorum]
MEFEPRRAQLLARGRVPLSEVLAELRAEETRLRGAGLLAVPSALAARGPPVPSARGSPVPSASLRSPAPPLLSTPPVQGQSQSQQPRGPRPPCAFCGKAGHDVSGCWRRDPSLRQQYLDKLARRQAGCSGSSAVAQAGSSGSGGHYPWSSWSARCYRLFSTGNAGSVSALRHRATTTFYTVRTAVQALVGAGPRSLESRGLWELDWLRESISPSTCVVSLLSRARLPSSRVPAHMLKMVSPSLAMAEEIAALERTGTWDLVSPPPGVRPITCKWVYKIKTRSDGSLERYKARLVARGFQQEHGRDYDETFAPVAHMTTVRTLLAVASVRRWSVSQLDVQNAFLNGELSEEVYMQPPPGYSVPDGMVCRLRRSLYGLKQAPRAWFERFASMVTAAGFSPSFHDPALFVHTSPRGRTLLLLYVDDMIITGDDPEYISFVKARLRDQFLMTDLGPLRYFLGIEISSTSDGFYISQEKYIQDLLTRAALVDERTVETPMELNVKLRPTDGDPLPDPTRYRHLVGSLVYLAVTRPDISYPVHILSLFVSAPTIVHYSHLLRVLRYLRGTITRRLFFPSSSFSPAPVLLGCYLGE